MAANPRLQRLKDEFLGLRGGIQYLDDLAGSEDRDLTVDERTKYDDACTRMEQIDADIKETVGRQERFDAIADVVADVDTGTDAGGTLARTSPRSPVQVTDNGGMPFGATGSQAALQSVESLGEYALTLGRMKVGKIDETEANDILGRVVAHGVAADGIAPTTIEGDLINFVDANRYAVNAARRLPMPDNRAKTFQRPRVTQRTTVATQAAEGDVLSSQRLTLTGDTVTKVTKGGVLSLSEQEIDWTEPAMLGLAIQDLAESYAINTDDFLCSAIETAFTASAQTVLSLTAASDVFIAAVATAAGVVYGTSKKLADTLFVSIDRWAYLASLVDADDRPLFPMSGPVNVPGSNGVGVATFTGYNILGLNVVVDPNFTAGVWGVAVSSLIEFYEQNKGLLNIASPSTLEVQYAYRGYVAANVYAAGVDAFETS